MKLVTLEYEIYPNVLPIYGSVNFEKILYDPFILLLFEIQILNLKMKDVPDTVFVSNDIYRPTMKAN